MDMSGAMIESVCLGPEESKRNKEREREREGGGEEFSTFLKNADFFSIQSFCYFFDIITLVAIRQ